MIPASTYSYSNVHFFELLASDSATPRLPVPHTPDEQTESLYPLEVNQMSTVNDRITQWVNSLSTPLYPSPASLAPAHGRLLRSGTRRPLATIQAPNRQPVARKRKRTTVPPASKPTQRDKKKRRLGKTMESEDELAMQSSRPTRSRRVAPKDQPSLAATNRPTPNNARDPDKQDPATYRTSADALDQLSDMKIQPAPPLVSSPRKKSRSPSKASSPSKQSSVEDVSQNSKGSRTVTKKESLALMNPPVVFTSFSTITEPGRSLPPLAQQLWMDHLRSACSSAAPSIPDTLKVREAPSVTNNAILIADE